MHWFGTLLHLGMLAFPAKSEVVPDAVELTCTPSLLPDSTVRFQVTPPPTSKESDSSWQMKDETKFAHFPDCNRTLVKDLTDSSITMYQCMGFLHYSRKEWNVTGNLRMCWAECEVNCSALMKQLTPSLTLAAHANSTNSTKPPAMDTQRLGPLTLCLSVGSGVVVAALFGFGVMRLKKWYTNKKNGNRSTTNYTSADERMNFQPDRRDDDMC